MAQIRPENPVGHQLLDVTDPLIARPLELVQRQPGLAVGLIELLGTASRIPLRLEFRQRAGDLLEADAVGARIRSGIRREFEAAAGHHIGDDLRQIADAVIVLAVADIERLIANALSPAPPARR